MVRRAATRCALAVSHSLPFIGADFRMRDARAQMALRAGAPASYKGLNYGVEGTLGDRSSCHRNDSGCRCAGHCCPACGHRLTRSADVEIGNSNHPSQARRRSSGLPLRSIVIWDASPFGSMKFARIPSGVGSRSNFLPFASRRSVVSSHAM
jgi:hypothetical protein